MCSKAHQLQRWLTCVPADLTAAAAAGQSAALGRRLPAGHCSRHSPLYSLSASPHEGAGQCSAHPGSGPELTAASSQISQLYWQQHEALPFPGRAWQRLCLSALPEQPASSCRITDRVSMRPFSDTLLFKCGAACCLNSALRLACHALQLGHQAWAGCQLCFCHQVEPRLARHADMQSLPCLQVCQDAEGMQHTLQGLDDGTDGAAGA